MFHRARWKRVSESELDEVVARLEHWPCPAGGAVRHMFALATAESDGGSSFRVASTRDGWACCVLQPGELIVPCGDAEVIAEAGVPISRWRLLVGDAAAADAVLAQWGDDGGLVVHRQRFLVVEPSRVPGPEEIADPGLRPATQADVDGLADLAVQLHLDDQYGGHPGRSGRRAYRRRMARTVDRGRMWVVGEVGDPLLKIERSVDSERYGVQLAGIVDRPDVRGHGLGRAAVTAAVRDALRGHPGRPVALHVRADNEVALNVYATAGFVDQEEWRLAIRRS